MLFFHLDMTKRLGYLSLFLLCFCCIFRIASAENEPSQLKFAKSAEDVIYYVPQFSDFEEISIHEMRFLKEVLEEAKKNNAKAVIFEIDTPGGRIDVALKYVSILAKSEVPTIAFVNPQAISAGMIIALAADRIAINPNGTIGDAMPIQMTQMGVRPITDKPQAEKDKKPELESKEKTGDTEQGKEVKENKEDKKESAEKTDKPEQESKKEKTSENLTLKKILKEFEKLKEEQDQSPEEKKLADQKFLTVYFKVLQVLAEKNNRPVRVVRAMADPYQKLSEKEDGIEHSKVSPLTLSAIEAKRLNVVDYICRSKSILKDELGLTQCKIITKNKTPSHYIIFFLAHPFISAVLIILGIIGLYIEAKTPGFGVPGGIGILALTLFFIGHVGVGDSNWIPTVIFIIGVILLALEIFVIPGFGITGILGIISIFAALLLAFGWDNIELAINTVGVALIVSTVAIVLLTVYVLPKTTMFKKITLETSHTQEEGFSSHKEPDKELVGKEGIVHTTLRPTGLAIINDQRLDVMTEGDFIEKGKKIVVTRINGMQIIVKKV